MYWKPGQRNANADVFAFSGDLDATARVWENATAIWAAPWRAYWAVTLEALDPSNYGR